MRPSSSFAGSGPPSGFRSSSLPTDGQCGTEPWACSAGRTTPAHVEAMNSSVRETIPLACVPGAIPADMRAGHFELVGDLFGRSLQERVELTDGYEFRFEPEEFERVARFVANERRCCPFLDFTISLVSGGALWLRLTGPAGSRAFIDAEL